MTSLDPSLLSEVGTQRMHPRLGNLLLDVDRRFPSQVPLAILRIPEQKFHAANRPPSSRSFDQGNLTKWIDTVAWDSIRAGGRAYGENDCQIKIARHGSELLLQAYGEIANAGRGS